MIQDRQIQAVIFDVGGVLDQPADGREEEKDRAVLAAGLGLSLDEMWSHFYRTENWRRARVGKISDDEFWRLNLEPFGIHDPAARQAFVQRLNRFKEINPAMRALLEELSGRVRLAIISNASDVLEGLLQNRFQVWDYFELVTNSARVGYAKPDPAIFEWTLDQLELAPQHTLFTDDQQHNVDAAIELGMNAAPFEHADAFRASLVERGVLPA
jgi:HAD superfamily hydrolase (TIGR01509 family)